MKNIAKGAITLGVLVVATIVGYGLVLSAPEAKRIEPQEVSTAIRVTTVQKSQVLLKVRSQGSVVPRTQSELTPEVSGRVQWISPNLVPGGFFKKDETLIRLDGRDHKSVVERNQATVERRRAEDEHARFELRRMQQLVKENLTSQSTLESAIRTQRIATATLKEAEIVLSQAQRDFWRTEIKAPYDGLVRTEKVDLGQYVTKGQSIGSVYASDSIEVRLPIADNQLAYLDLPLGSRGELPPDVAPDVLLTTDYGGKEYEWHGKLVRTEAEIDARSRMVNAIARVEGLDAGEQPPLPIGLFVNAEINGLAVDNVISLPRAAIRNGNQVLVVDAQSRLRYRTVELLRFDRDHVYISAGLNNGEKVNLSPIQTVLDGMPVTVATNTAVAAQSDRVELGEAE